MKEFVTLSTEHQQAIQQGRSVAVTESATQNERVVVRADVFEQIKKVLSDFEPADAYPVIDEVMIEGWDDPKMAEYDQYASHKK